MVYKVSITNIEIFADDFGNKLTKPDLNENTYNLYIDLLWVHYILKLIEDFILLIESIYICTVCLGDVLKEIFFEKSQWKLKSILLKIIRRRYL